MVLGVIFSYMGTLIHAHIYPAILSPLSSSAFTSYASFNFLFGGNFLVFSLLAGVLSWPEVSVCLYAM